MSGNHYEEQFKFLSKETSPIMVKDSRLQTVYISKILDTMLFVFFWVIPRRLIYICRRFGTLYLFHLQRQVCL